MHDTNDRTASKPLDTAGTTPTGTQNQVEDRLAEATSKETVKDLENTNSKPDRPPNGTSIPSPDGAPDDERNGGRADSSDTSGPM